MSEHSQETSAPLAEISHGPGDFEQFLERNQKSLLALVAILIFAIIGWMIYGSIRSHRQETAGAALVKANDLAALQKVTSDFPGTNAAGSAALLIAAEQWKTGQQEAAIATLKNFISSHPKHPAIGAAKAKLAAKLMIQGKNEEASREFSEIASNPDATYLASYSLISQGDIALAAKNVEQAESLYKKALADFPESQFSQLASARLASLRAKPPSEIDPPPAPPADKTPTGPSTPSLIPNGSVTLPNGLQIEEVKDSEPPTSGEVSPSQSPDKP